MYRLMFAMLAFLWSAMLDTTGGGSGDGDGDGGGGEGGEGGFTLTEAELTQRTTKAAEDKAKEIATLLGIDPDKIGDAKGLIEAGRKAQQAAEGGSGGAGEGSDGGGEGGGVDALLDTLEKLENRLQSMETAEETRQRHAAEQARDEKLTAALKEANVRDDRLDAARTIALANGAKLNDKGELTGSKEAIAATKKALPEAFRGDGDDGKAADANGREKADRKPKSLTEALTAHYSKS